MPATVNNQYLFNIHMQGTCKRGIQYQVTDYTRCTNQKVCHFAFPTHTLTILSLVYAKGSTAKTNTGSRWSELPPMLAYTSLSNCFDNPHGALLFRSVLKYYTLSPSIAYSILSSKAELKFLPTMQNPTHEPE